MARYCDKCGLGLASAQTTATCPRCRQTDAAAQCAACGYVNEKKQNRHGETKAGWWCDDVFLGKDPVEALRIANGN